MENKKKYYDAKHNCFAYRCIENGTIVERFSDDGEPSKTAGAPMLDILKKKELINILVIVTRYFGGILLGTGGLVRAYTSSCLMALEQSNISQIQIVDEYFIEVNYSEVSKLKYICEKEHVVIKEEKYGENANIKLCTTIDKIRIIEKQINILKIEEGNKKILI